MKTQTKKEMNLNEIPTPETDAAWKDPQRTRDGTGFRSDVPSIDIALSVAEKSKDLERRLAVARDALERATIWSTENAILLVSKQALTLTAPKP